jgi:CRISPR-associated protein Cmr5
MRHRVDEFLPFAFKAIENVQIGNKRIYKEKDGARTVPKEFKGYISSLGASIIQAGVKAALTFYEAEESGSKSDRRFVNAAIKYILTKNSDTEYSDFKLTGLLEGLSSFDEQLRKAEEIMDAATALKLALRTYKME